MRIVTHGIERIDEYAWLKDANWREVLADQTRLTPEIRAHIDAENAYADAALAPLAGLRARLVAEMKGRVEQAAEGVPGPDGPFAYWTRYVPGAEHQQIMRGRRDGSAAEILVDGADLARGQAYFSLGTSAHSRDHRFLAYQIDLTGNERFTLRLRDMANRRDLDDEIESVNTYAWASDGATLYYVRVDEQNKSRVVYSHRVGTRAGEDVLVYTEPDPGFEVTLFGSADDRWVFISTEDQSTSEQWVIDTKAQDRRPILVEGRKPGMRYYVSDWGHEFLIRSNDAGAHDFRLSVAPTAAPAQENWSEIVAHESGRPITASTGFAGHLVWRERRDGLPRIVIRTRSGDEHAVTFEEEDYTVDYTPGYEYDTRTVRLTFSSPRTPEQTIDYDVETRERIVRKQDKVPSGHDPDRYVVRRLLAPTRDGERVPITVLHRRGLPADGSAAAYLEGYGAYGYSFEAAFSSTVLSLVDRGLVYAVAHPRGGGEKGELWRKGGQRHAKPNTFDDFIAAAEHLIAQRYTEPGRIVARGDSAGGLLMGAVANMRPDLFAGIVARVPFVDALNTMLDPDLPLTANEGPEWGDPIGDADAYRTIAGYAPYENVRAQAYPHMLVTSGISDWRVIYWEPAKWVARLRARKTNDARITLLTRMAAGHFGAAGRFENLDEVGLIFAFALDAVGLAESEPASRTAAPALDAITTGARRPAALDGGSAGRRRP